VWKSVKDFVPLWKIILFRDNSEQAILRSALGFVNFQSLAKVLMPLSMGQTKHFMKQNNRAETE
jgi:hypothetical protein